jgi:hypothetical protein
LIFIVDVQKQSFFFEDISIIFSDSGQQPVASRSNLTTDRRVNKQGLVLEQHNLFHVDPEEEHLLDRP